MLSRLLFYGFIVLALSVITSCSYDKKASDHPLSIEAPLGFKWTFDKQQTKQFKQVQARLCGNSALLGDKFELLGDERCPGHSSNYLHIPTQLLPDSFRDGKVSAEFNDKNEPVRFSYTYLHNAPIDPQENTKRRYAKARKLKAQLVKLYGAPTETRFYGEEGPLKLPQSSILNNCDLWFLEGVDIVLCPERTALIDGVEMGLDFIKTGEISNRINEYDENNNYVIEE